MTHDPYSDDVKRALLRKEQERAADELKQEAAKKAELDKIKSGETLYNYKALFETEAGQDILKDLKEFCFYEKSIYHDSPRQTDRNIGKNDVIHYLLEKLKQEEK